MKKVATLKLSRVNRKHGRWESEPGRRDAAVLWGGAHPSGYDFCVAVAPAPGEYEDSEAGNCYRKGRGLWALHDRPVHLSGRTTHDNIP